MIEINLLPDQKKAKLKPKSSEIQIKIKSYFYPLIIFFLFLHLSFLAGFLIRKAQLESLRRKWQALAPEKQNFDDFQKEYSLYLSNGQAIAEVIDQRLSWAVKLNRLSLDLPAGIWLEEVSSTNKNFTIRGSAVSLEKQEVGLINKFLHNLKGDAVFLKGLRNLELTSVQVRNLGTLDITDFLISGSLG